ncbi:hypothetical protein GOBAR_DD12578 [Gossypium barbadense]|nr:hypothetical protein GOBAR_DD12578 [Gossypium barbadense]
MEIVCQRNDFLKEVVVLKREKEKLDVLKNTKKELVGSKTITKKFGGQSEKLGEILATRRFEPHHHGLGHPKVGRAYKTLLLQVVGWSDAIAVRTGVRIKQSCQKQI